MERRRSGRRCAVLAEAERGRACGELLLLFVRMRGRSNFGSSVLSFLSDSPRLGGWPESYAHFVVLKMPGYGGSQSSSSSLKELKGEDKGSCESGILRVGRTRD